MLPVALLITSVLYLLSKCIYNLYFHPLRNFPGPWYCAISRLWYSTKYVGGQINDELNKLHEKFGDVVRIAPDELSYIDSKAWQEIYGKNRRPTSDFTESDVLFIEDNFFPSTADNAHLETVRTEMKHAIPKFLAKRGTRYWGSTLSSYVHSAVDQVGVYAEQNDNESIDVVVWCSNWLFDSTTKIVTGHDLEVSKSFPNSYPGIMALNKFLRLGFPVFFQFRFLPRIVMKPIEIILSYVIRGSAVDIFLPVGHLSKERMANGNEGDHNDLVSMILHDTKARQDDPKNIINVAPGLVLVAVESSSSFISGAIYCLLSNPESLSLLRKEILGRFSKAEDINAESTQDLPYLYACMMETLRIYPPVTGTFVRLVPETGSYICGRYVPGNTRVGVNHFASYRSSSHFYEPNLFNPERWLESRGKVFEGDDWKSFHPFLLGPRHCVGKELALTTTRLFLVRLLFEFELELDPKSHNWDEQRSHIVPLKTPLWVKCNKRVDQSDLGDGTLKTV